MISIRTAHYTMTLSYLSPKYQQEENSQKHEPCGRQWFSSSLALEDQSFAKWHVRADRQRSNEFWFLATLDLADLHRSSARAWL
mgnify:CR=1 FL=1